MSDIIVNRKENKISQPILFKTMINHLPELLSKDKHLKIAFCKNMQIEHSPFNEIKKLYQLICVYLL